MCNYHLKPELIIVSNILFILYLYNNMTRFVLVNIAFYMLDRYLPVSNRFSPDDGSNRFKCLSLLIITIRV